jgi:hypothetical protein
MNMIRFPIYGVVLCLAGVAAVPVVAQQPPTGVVYGCFNSSTSGPSFTLVDGKTYESRQGGHGKYNYVPATGLLEMLDGPYKGIRYLKQDSGFSFRVLRDNSMTMTSTSCPINKGKDPNKRPW